MARVAPLIVAVFLLGACGGGNSNPDAAQEAQVKQAWTSFFSTKTSVAAHVALLQDGARFRPVIASLIGNPLAKGLKASVSSVTLQGPNKAKVVYTLTIPGFPLGKQTGYAYKQNGKWLVGYAGLCKLVALGGSPPAACKS
jgi:hypothetical protein